ncbi:zinc finger, CCHC-type, retrotransposon gag domain protein, partial [Tanacetum coccineum]
MQQINVSSEFPAVIVNHLIPRGYKLRTLILKVALLVAIPTCDIHHGGLAVRGCLLYQLISIIVVAVNDTFVVIRNLAWKILRFAAAADLAVMTVKGIDRIEMIRILAGQLYMIAAMTYASSLSIMSLRVIGYVKVGLHAYVLENACTVEIMRILTGLSFYFAKIGRMAESDIYSPQQPPQTHIDYGFRTMVVCTVIGCDDGDMLLQIWNLAVMTAKGVNITDMIRVLAGQLSMVAAMAYAPFSLIISLSEPHGAYGCILAQPHFFSPRQMAPRRNRVNNEADPAFTAAVAQAVADLLPTLTARITDEIRQNENNRNNVNRRNARRVNTGGSGNDGDAQPTDIHVWLERFQKQKPQTFSSASTPVEAENWIAHIEKIFEVLGCGDQFKASQYFPYSVKEKCEREYKSIQVNYLNETSIDFMKRLLRWQDLETEFTDVSQIWHNRDQVYGYVTEGRSDRSGTVTGQGKACHRATGACFEYGEVGHLAKDCKK